MPPQPQQFRPDVLIVDDEVEMCELLEEFCRSHDLPTTTARDGRAAVDAIRRHPTRFGIVITDLHMPGADGFAVLNAARAANPSCYVVIVTGFGTIDTAVRAVREGAYDYLTKPFALGQLEVVIHRIRDRMDLQHENATLTREAGDRPSQMARDIDLRLKGIEDRLTQIESLLRSRP